MSSIDGLRERRSGPTVNKHSVVGQSVSPASYASPVSPSRKMPESSSERKINDSPTKTVSGTGQLAPSQGAITTGMAVKSKKKKKEKSGGHTNTIIMAIAGAAVVAIAVAVVVVLTNIFAQPNGSGEGEGEDNPALLSSNYDTTEEEDTITKKVMDELIEITIGELEMVQDEYGENGAIPVTVKNISDGRFNLAIEIVAKDKEGNPLDVASLYAEGIEPGQELLFHAFELSTLSNDQLRNATFEVHKAYTYENGVAETVTGGDVEVEAEPTTPEEGNVEGETADANVEVIEGE
ncbi:hypothetical protein IKF23_02510 [Candidatus Saccharibacteria bacterium]|nr:hypothetical protein [Candidatus Saccharibacteria bacterium]